MRREVVELAEWTTRFRVVEVAVIFRGGGAAEWYRNNAVMETIWNIYMGALKGFGRWERLGRIRSS